MKITPAHDVKDFEIAKRHGVKMLSIFDNRGLANENCGEFSVTQISYVDVYENLINQTICLRVFHVLNFVKKFLISCMKISYFTKSYLIK